MADSRYVPRDYLIDPALFSHRWKSVVWRTDLESTVDIDRASASRAQRAYCTAIKRAVVSAGYASIKDFAEEHDLNYARLARMLRGEIVMRLEDIATSERLLPGIASARSGR